MAAAGEYQVRWLSSGALVETQQSAKPLDAFYCAESGCRTISGLDQPIANALVVSLFVIMSGELASRLAERTFAKEDHSVEAFIFDGPDEPLRVGVHVGRRLQSIRTVR